MLFRGRVLRRALSRISSRLLVLVSRPFVDLTGTERLVFLGVAILHVIALGWGLPASDGWDVDGIAPRDFLPGVIKTFTPGEYFTYPPLHLALLSVLTLPVTIGALAKAPSLAQADVVATFVAVPVMTTYAIVARVVNALMALGIVLVMGRISAAIFGPRARVWAMAFAGVEVASAYYAHTTNLDVPALFWSSLALFVLVLALQRDEPKRLRKVALFAALAIASKDQAYALFALSMPIVLLVWALARKDTAARREVLREAFACAAIVVGLVLVVDGALFNPKGFMARVHFLTGHASQGYAMYTNDVAGRLATFRDVVLFLDRHYPVAIAPLVVLGMLGALAKGPSLWRVAGLVPLLGILSFTIAFNCVALRVEERFTMPQMQLCAVYAGGAVAVVLDAVKGKAAPWMIRVGGTAIVLSGVRLTAAMLGTMIGDARYDAERWMRENVRPDDVIEIYGNSVYFPRFPAGAHVERVGPGPVGARSPVPGVRERQDLLGNIDARRPRFIVVSTGYAWRFMVGPTPEPQQGHLIPSALGAILADEDSTRFMRTLFEQRAGYGVAHHSHYAGFPPLLPPRQLHASLACDIFVFERK